MANRRSRSTSSAAREIVLVLLDMVMPKLPGPECYRALRKLGRTPVLLVSGYAADQAAQDLLDSGAEGFLEKPYTAEQLGSRDRSDPRSRLGQADPASLRRFDLAGERLREVAPRTRTLG